MQCVRCHLKLRSEHCYTLPLLRGTGVKLLVDKVELRLLWHVSQQVPQPGIAYTPAFSRRSYRYEDVSPKLETLKPDHKPY